MNGEMYPFKTQEANQVFVDHNSKDLVPYERLQNGQGLMVWYCPSIWARIVFLFTGKMGLYFEANKLPAMALEVL